MSRGRRPEILAPAGDRERLEAALLYGADAVYLAGQRFGMRTSSRNFDGDGLCEAVRLCHAADCKVYITCNTLPREYELPALEEYLGLCQASGADALIVADMGTLRIARRAAPQMALHVSTQLGVTNSEAATMLYELGASRVVLARELSLSEIAQLREHTPPELELEAFVHGAMCMAWSGRCMLSAYLTGRDGSRGDCAQPCRWKYGLVEEQRPGLVYGAEEDADGTYLFNANDLCMIDHVAQLSAAGIDSFKIEGRAKAAYYAAVTTNAYRIAAEEYAASGFNPAYRPAPWLRRELETVSHRPYGTGFYFGRPEQNVRTGGYLRTWEVAAVAGEYADGRLHLTQRNRFAVGDTCELLEPGRPPQPLRFTALYDAQGQSVSCAPHPMMDVWIPFDRPVVPGSFLRREKVENRNTV